MPIDQSLFARDGAPPSGRGPGPTTLRSSKPLERFDIRVSSRFVMEWLDEGVA
jgi:hypothetical protein